MSDVLRLFVGVPVAPEQIPFALDFADVWRPVPAQNWHLTLAFLGPCRRQQLATLQACVDQCCRAISRCNVVLDQWRYLPHAGRPGSLVLVADAQPLYACYQNLWQALAAQGWPRPAREFLLHLTLARGRQGPLPALVAPITIAVQSLCLFLSRPVPGGVRYDRLYCRPFVGQ